MTKQFTKLTDYPWAILSPFLPFKRKRNLDLCDVMNAILWLLRTSCHGAARAVAELTQ
ncbi:transposase [Spirosoma pulveris]